MSHVYLPYKIGGDSPIPNLFEEIVPHFDPSAFEFTVYAWERPRDLPENVHQRPVSRDSQWRRRAQYIAGALGRYDMVHTGGRPRMHYHLSRLAHLRNRDLRHVHTFRVDVDLSWDYHDERMAMLDRADAVTAVSEHTARTAREKLGVDPTVIYNGIDTDLFRPEYDRPELFDQLGITDEEEVFLFVGTLEDRKRPGDVVSVAETLQETTFVVIGSGPLEAELRRRAEELDNVHLTGRLEKSRLPAIYANATGFLFPSIREGCPNVVLEAMASALPVVGYEATSMPELVTTGQTGHLSAVDDTSGLATGVREAIEYAEEWGTNARAYIRENHTFDRLASQYERVYRDVLDL